MTHKADGQFFEEKRNWSRRKDEILRCYLSAYIPKIMNLKRPVIIIDGFAGPGLFEDQSHGSPLIICNAVKDALSKNLRARQKLRVVCIEKDEEIFAKLESNLKHFEFASAKHGSFIDFADKIAQVANTHSLFLYVDPFTVRGLVWEELDRIYSSLDSGSSVEVLLNLNSQSFVREALSVLKTDLSGMDDESSGDEQVIGDTQIATLNSIAGGTWWKELIAERLDFPSTVTEFSRRYCEQMKRRFAEVVFHPIKAKPHHTVAKYDLVFGTRHVDGLKLMNDEMVKSRRELADMALPKEPTLFEVRSEELVPDVQRLPQIILDIARIPSARKEVMAVVVKSHFCEFHQTEIRRCIATLLATNQLKSDSRSSRINDETKIWTTKSL